MGVEVGVFCFDRDFEGVGVGFDKGLSSAVKNGKKRLRKIKNRRNLDLFKWVCLILGFRKVDLEN